MQPRRKQPLNAFLFHVVSIVLLVSYGLLSEAQDTPPAFFRLEGGHTFGCCDNAQYTLETGGASDFVRNPGGTGSIAAHGSFGASRGTVVLNMYENENQSDSSIVTFKLYVLGPPGTPFHVQYNYVERARAYNSGDGFIVSVDCFSFQNFGLQASGHQYQQQDLPGGSTVDGYTSSDAITYLGQEYSLAWESGSWIEYGANTCCGDYHGHAEADWTLSVQVGDSSCAVPTIETTNPGSWYSKNPNRTEMQWWQMVSDGIGTDFSLRSIEEVDGGNAVDTCWFEGSEVPQVTGITSLESQQQWAVGLGNIWGPDLVDWSEDAVQYYRGKGKAPCLFQVRQQMVISCSESDNPTLSYGGVNILMGVILNDSVMSCRGRSVSPVPGLRP
jgi:hypothetical protein